MKKLGPIRRVSKHPMLRKWKPRAPSNKNLNNKIKRIQSKQELKHIDTYQAGVSIPTAGVLQLLNGVIEGDSSVTREGNDITLTSVQFRLQFSTNAADLSSMLVRMIVFYDQQANGAAPTVATLLDTSVITPIYLAPYNHNYQKRYRIVYDKLITATPQTVNTTVGGVTTLNNPIERVIKKKRKLGRVVKYNDNNTATITSIVTNSLYVLYLSDNNTNQPTVFAGYRVYFKDD